MSSVTDADVDRALATFYGSGGVADDAAEEIRRDMRRALEEFAEDYISDECDQLRAKLAALLTRTANALKGEPEPGTSHSWHDLPEIATVMAAPARFTEGDFVFVGAVAADMLRRLWNHNPDLVSDAFTPFVIGETEHGELAVWNGQPDDTTPAVATFGSTEDDAFESAVAWIAQHRDDVATVERAHDSGSGE